MKKLMLVLFFMMLGACTTSYDQISGPDYNYIAAHVNVIDKSSGHVVYEYSDIRVDEIAPVAAIYCHNNGGGRQATLYDIKLHRNNRRHATFVCR